MKAGAQTRIGVYVPRLSQIKPTVSLSKEARLRLKWIDYYQGHGENTRLTCRHFGIHHRTFYRYYKRFQTSGPKGLETRSSRPHNMRASLIPREVIDTVKKLRQANPELSKYKLAILLKKDH